MICIEKDLEWLQTQLSTQHDGVLALNLSVVLGTQGMQLRSALQRQHLMHILVTCKAETGKETASVTAPGMHLVLNIILSSRFGDIYQSAVMLHLS